MKQHNIESTEAINPTITIISHEFIAVPVGGIDPVVVVEEVDVLVEVEVDVLLDVLVVVVEEVAVVVSHSSGVPFPFESLL